MTYKRYTLKRNPYKKYKFAEWSWYSLFIRIDELKKISKKSFFIKVSIESGVNIKTLSNKYYKWVNEKRQENIYDNRGIHKKIFTEAEQLDLYNYIENVYIKTFLPLNNEDIIIMAMIKWKALNINNKNFKASSGWCTNFKKKWNLSSVKPKYTKRATYICSADEIASFKNQCKLAIDLVSNNNVFNMDETFWRMINFSQSTIGIKGSESTKIIYNGDDKKGFTAVLTISAEGTFLKPIVITKGKTANSLNKLNLNKDKIIGCYSNNGWINNGIMKIVLEQIHEKTKGEKSYLILDQYPAHKTDFVKGEALNKNINLIYIPVGMTSKLQPLDVKINGAIKSKSRTFWRKKLIDDPFNKPKLSDAIVHLIDSCNLITKSTIVNVFDEICKT